MKAARAAKARGFTLTEVLIVIAIIAVIAAILFPVMAMVKRSGRASACSDHLRQIGVAAQIYASDNEDCYPFSVIGGNEWLRRMDLTIRKAYRVNDAILKCPDYQLPAENSLPEESGYAYNVCTSEKAPANHSKTAMVGEAAVYHPIDQPTINIFTDFLYFPDAYIADMRSWILDTYGSRYAPVGEWGSRRHMGQGNYVFYDTHMKRLPPEAFKIPAWGHPCAKKAEAWKGPPDGPVFDPAGAL